MAKSKSRRAPVNAKRSAKKAAAARSRKGPKSARKATKPPARPARAAKANRTAKKPAAPKKKAAAKTSQPRAARAIKTPAQKTAKTPMRRPPTLDRERRKVSDDITPTPPSSLDLDRSASAARSGRAELVERLREHTSTSPAMTAGDVDADWESAEAIGDEAPGGDNPTPDQDVVDEIGRAVGIEYDDDEELQGGDEIAKRDKKRWELDPASSDDFDER